MLVELARAVHRVDRRYDRVEPEKMAQQRIVEQELHDRRRIGEPGRLDQDTSEGRHLAAVALHQEVPERLFEVAAYRAADAAARHDRNLALDGGDQQMVERDLAELVDDDGAVRHIAVPQQMIEHRRLAAAEKPGDERYRQAIGGFVALE